MIDLWNKPLPNVDITVEGKKMEITETSRPVGVILSLIYNKVVITIDACSYAF